MSLRYLVVSIKKKVMRKGKKMKKKRCKSKGHKTQPNRAPNGQNWSKLNEKQYLKNQSYVYLLITDHCKLLLKANTIYSSMNTQEILRNKSDKRCLRL